MFKGEKKPIFQAYQHYFFVQKLGSYCISHLESFCKSKTLKQS